jgi:hypothetical protein
VFEWDSFSDQPKKLDKRVKRKYVERNIFAISKTYLLSLFLFPLSLFRLLFPLSRKEIDISDFFGIGINLDKSEKQVELLKELNLKNITIRFPLWEMERIDEYLQFVKQFPDHKTLLTVVQDRVNIENRELFKKNIETVFKKFSPVVKEFQIGNAINRKKWAFFSVDEYLQFYKTAFDVRNREFPDIKLVGSSVIDFEFYFTIHTLFNFRKIFFNRVSALLYVDRRGAPENRQALFFNLEKKIAMLWAIVLNSRKSENKIYITETNYPIEHTEPYTPTSQYEAISLKEYKIYMVRYLLIAISTGRVERVYWHQLISAGYGLVDNRLKNPQKYPSFHVLKTLLEILEGEKYISHKFSGGVYKIEFTTVEVYWSLSKKEREIDFKEEREIISIDGWKSRDTLIKLSKTPIYVKK